MGRIERCVSPCLAGVVVPAIAPDPHVATVLAVAAAVILWLVVSGRGRDDARAETGATVVSAQLAARSLARFVGRPVVLRVPPGTPVLLAPGAAVADPWELEVALARSGVRLRLRNGRVEMLSVGGA